MLKKTTTEDHTTRVEAAWRAAEACIRSVSELWTIDRAYGATAQAVAAVALDRPAPLADVARDETVLAITNLHQAVVSAREHIVPLLDTFTQVAHGRRGQAGGIIRTSAHEAAWVLAETILDRIWRRIDPESYGLATEKLPHRQQGRPELWTFPEPRDFPLVQVHTGWFYPFSKRRSAGSWLQTYRFETRNLLLSCEEEKARASRSARARDPDTSTIWYHGGQCYSAANTQPIVVSCEMHNLLHAFLDRDNALGTRTLQNHGVTNVTTVMTKLAAKFGECCVRRPKSKGDGYYIRVRTHHS
jgi:hypothetical protein